MDDLAMWLAENHESLFTEKENGTDHKETSAMVNGLDKKKKRIWIWLCNKEKIRSKKHS